MYQSQQQDPAHIRLDDIPTEIARKELLGFLGIRLSYEHQHGRRQGRLEALVAVHIHDGYTIEEDVEQPLHPDAELTGYQRQDSTEEIDIQKQFRHRQFVRLCPTIPQIVGHNLELGTQIAQGKHKHEEGAVFLNRCKQPAYHLEYVQTLKHSSPFP